ncbi:hypothetical protein KFL_004170110 [Klebsormidium nitens]|uniref:Protein RIK n=1 Tax=Klebsormidium nitens TaxID=105231 RepID=A0A1Y1ICJ3_KLENI|nr:hypothetical protein KFL_004170110 [Klebsormidium nitens]|eukprot:GAQ88313.1 hypothetical protein KFL_004170110 [Klebsormidium nitens]
MEPKQDRKKRKWDVPGTAPAPVAGVAPSILGQPFGAGPDHVAAAAASQLLHKYPQLAVPQAVPMGVPGSSAAEEIRKKINQTLMQRGLIPGAKVDDSAAEREIVINDAPTAIRSQLTRRPVQEEIQRETGSVIITRGRYKAPGAPLDPSEKPLHLHISPGAHLPNEIAKQRAMEHAVTIVEDILKGGPGLRPRQGLVKPVTAMHTLFLHVGIEADAGFGLAARIRGPNNAYLDHISNESGAVLELRGRGSGTKEGPEGKEKDEPLQLVLMCSTAAGLDQAKKLANNLLDTIRTDWDAYSKPAAGTASAAAAAPPVAPQYPPYYYGYPYPPYPGAPPPYGAAPPFYGYYPPPAGPMGAQPTGPEASPSAQAQAPTPTSAPASGDQYQHPQQAPAASAATAAPLYPGSTAPAGPAGYSPAPYASPQDERKGIPPPPPEQRPPPPQSPAQTTPSPSPYQHMPPQQEQQYGHPDPYSHPAVPAPSSAPPPRAEPSPPPAPDAAPPPPSEEVPPAPPADASAHYQGYQYAPNGQPAQGLTQYPPQEQPEQGQGQYAVHGQPGQAQGQYAAQAYQGAAQGQYPPSGPQSGTGQYGAASGGGYAGPAAGASVYNLPVASYSAYPPPQSTQNGPSSQQQQFQPGPFSAQAQAQQGGYPPQGSGPAGGQYQQGRPAQPGPPAPYGGGGYPAAYQPSASGQASGYPGGMPQRPPQQQGPAEGEKKRKFQEFPTNGRGMPPQQANQGPLGLAPAGPTPGYGLGAQGLGAGGRGLMGPPPARAMGPPPMRGAMQQMGPPMNRPPAQSAQGYGIKLVDYGEEEEEENFRGSAGRPPHPGPQGGQGVQRPFWYPRG